MLEKELNIGFRNIIVLNRMELILKKELIIKQCKEGGYLPKYIIFNKNSSEQKALETEIKIIKYIKTKYPGCLTNI